MTMINPKIEYTEDNSPTLLHPITGDLYHSSRGAIGESEHVFIRNGLEKAISGGKKAVTVFEMGFGSGLNAWLTMEYARQNNVKIEYHTVEKYPIGMETIRKLHYTNDPAFAELHQAAWNTHMRISEFFGITKTEGDLVDMSFDTIFDVVYYDAFAPESQPELWTADIFRRFFDAMGKGSLLVTYSAKGTVKQALRDAGFEVKRLPGALGKRHMVAAEKH